MINAGTVAAYLTLDTSDFVKGIAAAGQRLAQFRNEQSDGISGMGAMISGFGAFLLDKINEIVGSVGSSAAIGALPGLLREKGALALQGFIGGIVSQSGAASSSMGAVLKLMRSAAGSVSFVSVGHNIVGGILSGMNGRRASLLAAAGNLAASVSGVIRSALKINSPSRVMMEIGEFTAQGMELGLSRGAESLYDTASAISRETAEALAGVSSVGASAYEACRASESGDRLGRLIDAVERLAASQSTVEIDGRPFGRLVREYV